MMYFKVSFKYSDSVYCSNIAVAECENDVRAHYASYSWVSIQPAADYDVDAARRRGMPIVTCAPAAVEPEPEPEPVQESAPAAAPVKGSREARKERGFSAASIAKVLRIANGYKARYMGAAPGSIKMCISKGNRKIGRVMNVSIMPVVTCGNCKECMHFCYDIKACLQYAGTVIDARMRNTCVLWLDRDLYFSTIDAAMKRRRSHKFFRWHVAGEIVDIDYFDRMVQNARNNPDFVIWTYTKMYSIVNAWIAAHGGTRDALPGNFHVMFSEWYGVPMVNPYGLPEFRCIMPGEVPPVAHKCPGNCDICKESGRGCVVGESTYTELH